MYVYIIGYIDWISIAIFINNMNSLLPPSLLAESLGTPGHLLLGGLEGGWRSAHWPAGAAPCCWSGRSTSAVSARSRNLQGEHFRTIIRGLMKTASITDKPFLTPLFAKISYFPTLHLNFCTKHARDHLHWETMDSKYFQGTNQF